MVIAGNEALVERGFDVSNRHLAGHSVSSLQSRYDAVGGGKRGGDGDAVRGARGDGRGQETRIHRRIEKGRFDRALLRQIERFVQRTDEIGPLPRAGVRSGDDQQHRLRRLVVGTRVVERDSRVARGCGNHFRPLVDQDVRIAARLD